MAYDPEESAKRLDAAERAVSNLQTIVSEQGYLDGDLAESLLHAYLTSARNIEAMLARFDIIAEYINETQGGEER